MPYYRVMRFYQSFPTAIPLYEVGYPRVTHPSATKTAKSTSGQALPLLQQSPFDLHVLSTPPAFILSQDQTLMLKFVLSRLAGLFFLKRVGFLSPVFTVFWVADQFNRSAVLSLTGSIRSVTTPFSVPKYWPECEILGNFKVVSLFNYQGSQTASPPQKNNAICCSYAPFWRVSK